MSTPYAALGGDPVVRALVDRFYVLMDTAPEYSTIRKLHPVDLGTSADKLYMFLSGWLGGPQLYAEKYGHPMLRARHLPFPIGDAERDQWVACMRQAMADVGIGDVMRAQLERAFRGTADWMRNRDTGIPMLDDSKTKGE